MILPEGCYIIINNKKQFTPEFFSEIPYDKYISNDLNHLLSESKVDISTLNMEKLMILIEDIRIVFLICSNVLKINKLLYNDYTINKNLL